MMTRFAAYTAALLVAALPLRALSQTKPLDPANRDTTCQPCRDFYRYANGGWLARTTMPSDRSRWGAFYELDERNNAVLHDILEDARAKAQKTSDPNVKKLGVFYGTCVDSVRAESDGLHPLDGELARIAAIRTGRDVETELARLHRLRVGAAFALYASPDAKQSRRTIARIYQGGLGLPDREYYLKADSASALLRRRYVEHVATMFRLAGSDSASAARDAAGVFAFETTLARASMTREAQRDPESVYHLMKIAELRRAAPTFDWRSYFTNVGLRQPGDVNVGQPAFLATFDSLRVHAPIQAWQAYFRWKLLAAAAPMLSRPFVQESFHFNGTVLQGTPAMRPRWKQCLSRADGAVGELLGRAYVKEHFTPATKARALAMVRNIQAEFRARLDTLSWMSQATKTKAYRKLETMLVKIGYPDRWRDYSSLVVTDGPFVLNQFRANLFEHRRQMAKIGRPTDRTEWEMTPPTVNASYDPSVNEIVFPAGIMQPPFFDPNADDAVNYGGMGSVIGHEITHGFDDEGRQFDADGNLSGWWTAADARAFTERAEVLRRQFDSSIAIDSLHVNGKLTLGENIADLGGVLIAYGAYKRSLAGKPAPAPIDGSTGEQRFFLAWAQIWRNLSRPEAARLLVATDPHAPAHLRVMVPLSNIPAFAEAFHCQLGDTMVRPAVSRAQIW